MVGGWRGAVGRKILAEFPDTTGSLGCAISEAVECAASTPNTRYVQMCIRDRIRKENGIMEKRYTLPVAIALVVGTVIGSGVFFKAEACLLYTSSTNGQKVSVVK